MSFLGWLGPARAASTTTASTVAMFTTGGAIPLD
jgi:hypothetical protein